MKFRENTTETFSALRIAFTVFKDDQKIDVTYSEPIKIICKTPKRKRVEPVVKKKNDELSGLVDTQHTVGQQRALFASCKNCAKINAQLDSSMTQIVKHVAGSVSNCRNNWHVTRQQQLPTRQQ